MNKQKLIILGCAVIVCGVAGYCWFVNRGHNHPAQGRKIITVSYGSIQNAVSATGNIQPQNRLGLKPPIGGRIEKILVEEGQRVKTGDVLAIMSSTERAALLDAARLQGGDALKEWEDVYKPTPLLAPIDGEVIVKSVNPGQTVTAADEVIVLSDRLIVQAQVDETDIGKVKLGQTAVITLDAYPEIEVKGKVDHIYYESKIVNNVTIYAVDIVGDQVPEVFRSGMSANVQIIQARKDHILLIPREAVKKEEGKNFVLLMEVGRKKPVRQEVQLGVMDDNNAEVVSGLKPEDQIVIATQKYTPPNKNSKSTSSPFMPAGGGRGGR